MLELLITTICLTTNPTYNQACNQALNAVSIQIHLKQDLDNLQQNFTKNVETEVDRTTGREIWIAGIVYYQIYTKQTLAFSTNAKPLADSLSGSFNNNSYNLGLTWTF